MKYVKLFEEFAENEIKYELKKSLDLDLGNWRGMNDLNPDKVKALVNELEKAGFECSQTILNIDAFINALINQSMAVDWTGYNNKYTFYKNNFTGINNNAVLVFDDYFELKHEYRGHNLKKFGV